MTELPTYTSVFRLQRRLYAIYDWELPVPVGLLEAGVFIVGVALFALIGRIAGIDLTPGTAWFFIVPPGFMAYAARKPFADGKQPHAWLTAQIRFALEPRSLDGLADAASRRRRARGGVMAATAVAEPDVATEVADAPAAPEMRAPAEVSVVEAAAVPPPVVEVAPSETPSSRRRRLRGSQAPTSRRRRNGPHGESSAPSRRRAAGSGAADAAVGNDVADAEVAVAPPTRQVGEGSDSSAGNAAGAGDVAAEAVDAVADGPSAVEPTLDPTVEPALGPAAPLPRPASRRATRRHARREARREARRRRARWAAAGRQVRAAARAAREAADAQAKEAARLGRQHAKADRAAAKDAARAARAARKRPPVDAGADVEAGLVDARDGARDDAAGPTASDVHIAHEVTTDRVAETGGAAGRTTTGTGDGALAPDIPAPSRRRHPGRQATPDRQRKRTRRVQAPVITEDTVGATPAQTTEAAHQDGAS